MVEVDWGELLMDEVLADRAPRAIDDVCCCGGTAGCCTAWSAGTA